MTVQFTKMHGLGNDFMVLDGISQSLKLTPEWICRMADRHTGVGFDQLLCIEHAKKSHCDFAYRIFNADGNEVEQCGNGARCVAKFLHEQGLTDKRHLLVETLGGDIELFLEESGQVRVNMGQPILDPQRIPFNATQAAISHQLRLFDAGITITAVSMGNPHAVLTVDNVMDAPVARLGPLIEKHERFPQGTNVGFMQISSRELIKLRVFERGAGETLACGTGACAAMVAARLHKLVDERVTVSLPGGDLCICWSGQQDDPVWMIGPAQTVYCATLVSG